MRKRNATPSSLTVSTPSVSVKAPALVGTEQRTQKDEEYHLGDGLVRDHAGDQRAGEGDEQYHQKGDERSGHENP